MSSGITDSSLTYHLENAKAHGVTRTEISAIVTHVGFYVGWPKVAYFSATNNTEGVAQKLADGLGADLYKITPSNSIRMRIWTMAIPAAVPPWR